MRRTPTYALVLLLAGPAGCNSMSPPMAPAALLAREKPPEIRVMTLAGRSVTVYAPRLEGDSLVGHAGDSSTNPGRRVNTPIAIPTDSVRFVTVNRTDAGRSFTGMTLGVGALLAILFVTTAAWKF